MKVQTVLDGQEILDRLLRPPASVAGQEMLSGGMQW